MSRVGIATMRPSFVVTKASLMPPEVANSLSGTGNGVALVVQQLADQHRELHVFATVLAMRAPCFFGSKSCELRLPIAQCMRLDPYDVCDLADLEEQLVRQLRTPCHQTHLV